MRYFDLVEYLGRGKAKDLQSLVLGGKKNEQIRMYRDYYNGKQWDYNGWLTDTTRSGRKVWHIHKKSPNDMGVGEGELQVFNVCDAVVNIYSSYSRGSIHDDNRIVVDGLEDISDRANELVNLDILVSRGVTRMGVDSVCVLKYEEDGTLKFVDGLEVAPIYDGDERVGTIRVYAISKNDPLVVESGLDIKKGSVMYMELWYPKDGVMWLEKYVNEYKVSEGKAPFEFDPYIYIANKDNEFVKFDENSTEISDVGRLITVQDALNKTITEEGIIISKVAFPMIKVIKEVYDMMAEGKIDGEKLKKDLAEISLVAGKIISAPIERESGQDMPNGVNQYVDYIFEQIHRITGIPKGVFVSEGISNVSEKTMSAMMESLKRRVDEKRANIESGVKDYIVMMTGREDLRDKVHIEWSEIFGMSKEEQAELLIRSHEAGIFPIEYTVEKILEILGDGEKLDEIVGSILNGDVNKKIDIEREKIKADMEKVVKVKEDQLSKEREQRMQAEIDKTLLGRELENITSSI